MKYTYKYVHRHTHTHTRKLTHAHRLHTWYANFERFVYENLCATAADYAPRAIGNGHQQDMPPVHHLLPTSPYWPIDFVKSAQLLFFFTFWRFVRFFTYFFFISKVCSHCAALSRLRQLFSVQPMCLVGKWDEEGERERAKWERLSHMCWYAHARSTQKNIGNPTHTYTTFYTSTHTHTHVYTLLSLKIKFILKYVENSILE